MLHIPDDGNCFQVVLERKLEKSVVNGVKPYLNCVALSLQIITVFTTFLSFLSFLNYLSSMSSPSSLSSLRTLFSLFSL